MRRHGLKVLAVLIVIEAMGFLADWRWGFQPKLLAAIFQARRSSSNWDNEWLNPEAPFSPAYAFRDPIRTRVSGSDSPVGAVLDETKLPPGRRIFVIGESAAYAMGCSLEESFAGLLDQRLEASGTRVWTVGQPGASPWMVMEQAAQVLKTLNPSTLIIFTGNNVWKSWWAPQLSGLSQRSLFLVLGVLAQSRAIAGLEYAALQLAARVRPSGGAFNDYVEMTGSAYALAHPLEEVPEFGPADWAKVKTRHLERFRTSLQLIAQHAHAAGVRVVFVTMPLNYRLSPAWQHPQFEAYDRDHRDEVRRRLRKAGQLVTHGDCDGAMAEIDQALTLDPQPPVLHYLRAQCLERSNRLAEAEEEYAQCRENMIGQLGGLLSVNAVVREVATSTKAPLVDAVELFKEYQRTHDQHFNAELLVDDCHLSVLGHRLLADALAPLL